MFPLFRQRVSRRVLALALVEFCVLVTAAAGFVIVRSDVVSTVDTVSRLALPVFSFAAATLVQFSLASFGLYVASSMYSRRRVLISLAGSWVLVAVLFTPLCVSFAYAAGDAFAFGVGSHLLLVTFVLGVILLVRLAFLRATGAASFLGNVLLVGSDEHTGDMLRQAYNSHGGHLRVVGVVDGAGATSGSEFNSVPPVGSVEDLESVVDEMGVDTLIICMPYQDERLPFDALMNCQLKGKRVLDSGSFYESLTHRVLVSRIDPNWIPSPDCYRLSRFRWLMKWTCEWIVAAAALLLALVPLTLVALLRRLTCRGPLFSYEERVGKNGRQIKLHQFTIAGATSAVGRAIERWLSHSAVRTWPRLINVLCGQLSFVGPRPETRGRVEERMTVEPLYHHRHFIRPGIIAWGDIYSVVPEPTDPAEMARLQLGYDLYYLKHMTLFFDALIVLAWFVGWRGSSRSTNRTAGGRFAVR